MKKEERIKELFDEFVEEIEEIEKDEKLKLLSMTSQLESEIVQSQIKRLREEQLRIYTKLLFVQLWAIIITSVLILNLLGVI